MVVHPMMGARMIDLIRNQTWWIIVTEME